MVIMKNKNWELIDGFVTTAKLLGWRVDKRVTRGGLDYYELIGSECRIEMWFDFNRKEVSSARKWIKGITDKEEINCLNVEKFNLYMEDLIEWL